MILNLKELEAIKRTSVAVSTNISEQVESNNIDLFYSINVDLSVSATETTISGALFSPQLKKKPSICRAIKWDGDNGLDVSNIVVGYTRNGDYYDVIISALEEQLLNVTISII